MNSATTAAVQYRLKEWTEQSRECQNRPAGMSVVDWCAGHGITNANYHYRLHQGACMSDYQKKLPQIFSDNICGMTKR